MKTHPPQPPRKLSLLLTALAELGIQQMARAALYRGLGRLRYWRHQPGRALTGNWPLVLAGIPRISTDELRAIQGLDTQQVLAEAEEVCQGRYLFFGVSWEPLNFSHSGLLGHWSEYDRGVFAGQDIKLTWEPARFGWVGSLIRAYVLTGEARYAQAFRNHFQAFLQAHPPYQGPNWASAQEVGIRLIWLVWAAAIFGPHLEESAQAQLSQALAEHAWRIPPTLLYARAQDNNHLLVEAAALYTAGVVLPAHPHARQWRSRGWRLFQAAILRQIAPDGTYMQQSVNYHRLMLQISLWMAALAGRQGQVFSAPVRQRLAAAYHWLVALVDQETGLAPNLGANDGAYLFPLSSTGFQDYRPVLQAAGLAWGSRAPFSPGSWDEMAGWLSFPEISGTLPPEAPPDLVRLQHPAHSSWLYLRTARFPRHRPGHADLLHLDLWWKSTNLAGDPGTYLYNGEPPWQNPWMTAHVHNTVTVNQQDQMQRLGRFLYVGKASAWLLQVEAARVTATQDSYDHLGISHRRTVEADLGGWVVSDHFVPREPLQVSPYLFQWSWLLPDWPWSVDAGTLELHAPDGVVKLATSIVSGNSHQSQPRLALYRAGNCILGDRPDEPLYGWRALTYAHKLPALMARFEWNGEFLPCTLTTRWQFPYNKAAEPA